MSRNPISLQRPATKSKRPATEAPEVVSDQDRDGTSGALAPPTANKSAASEGDAARRIADLERKRKDPEWIAARDASERTGKIVARVESVMMKATDYSNVK